MLAFKCHFLPSLILLFAILNATFWRLNASFGVLYAKSFFYEIRNWNCPCWQINANIWCLKHPRLAFMKLTPGLNMLPKRFKIEDRGYKVWVPKVWQDKTCGKNIVLPETFFCYWCYNQSSYWTLVSLKAWLSNSYSYWVRSECHCWFPFSHGHDVHIRII